ncbi:hypothetical protein LJB93_01230 [Desulfovibrio sp. OttesenSCG-928-F07]|nr:hypothetical protein [Desulfovibrio sp. OttesenSCG-928-F07]
MERMLQKLAKQLNQYDESSLMDLWHIYANKVAHFEPSARWEEDALIFCMIQSLHWKNQLFNAELAASVRRSKGMEDKMLQHELASLSRNLENTAGKNAKQNKAANTAPGSKNIAAGGPKIKKAKKPCTILTFEPKLPKTIEKNNATNNKKVSETKQEGQINTPAKNKTNNKAKNKNSKN